MSKKQSKDKCDNCGSTQSKTFYDFKDGSVLCDECDKKVGNEWEKKTKKKLEKDQCEKRSKPSVSEKVKQNRKKIKIGFSYGFILGIWNSFVMIKRIPSEGILFKIMLLMLMGIIWGIGGIIFYLIYSSIKEKLFKK